MIKPTSRFRTWMLRMLIIAALALALSLVCFRTAAGANDAFDNALQKGQYPKGMSNMAFLTQKVDEANRYTNIAMGAGALMTLSLVAAIVFEAKHIKHVRKQHVDAEPPTSVS